MNTKCFKVAAFYRFCRINKFGEVANIFTKFLTDKRDQGNSADSSRGSNGTVAGREKGIDRL